MSMFSMAMDIDITHTVNMYKVDGATDIKLFFFTFKSGINMI